MAVFVCHAFGAWLVSRHHLHLHHRVLFASCEAKMSIRLLEEEKQEEYTGSHRRFSVKMAPKGTKCREESCSLVRSVAGVL